MIKGFKRTILVSCLAVSLQGYSAQLYNQPYEDALKSFYIEDLDGAIIHLKNAIQNDPEHLPSRLLMAEVLLAKGDAIGAEIELEVALKQNADIKKVQPLILESYLLQDRFDEVINKATPFIGFNKVSSKILTLKARAYSSKGNLALANVEFGKALELDKKNSDAALGLAQIALKRGDADLAMQYTETALAISATNPTIFVIQSEIYQLQGNIDKSLSVISHAIALSPKHFPALLSRATLYIEKNEIENALKDIDVILADIPNEPRANYLKAVAAASLDDTETLESTVNHLNTVLTGLPNDVMRENPVYYYLAALVNYNQNEINIANDAINRYLDIVNDDPKALKLMAKVNFRLNKPFPAKNGLVKARLIDPDDMEIWMMLGQAYHQIGEYQKSERYYIDVVDAVPNYGKAWVNLGRLQLDMGKEEDALKSLVKGVELGSNDVSTRILLADVLRQNKNYEQAQLQLDKALVESPEASNVFVQQGKLYGEQSKHQLAKESFEKAISLNKNNLDAIVHLSRVEMALGNLTKTRELLEKAIIEHPGVARFNVELGDTYIVDGEARVAQSYYEKAYSIDQNSYLAVNKLISIYRASGNNSAAIKVANDFLTQNNQSAEVHLRLAEIYMSDNNYEKADNAYQLAVKHSADKAPVLVAYAKAQRVMQNPQAAENSLQKAISWNDSHFGAYLDLIKLYASLGNEKGALDYIESLFRKTNYSALANTLKGDLYLQLKQGEKAEKFYLMALKEETSQLASVGVSQALKMQGKVDEAVTALESFIKTNPRSVKALVAAADLHVEQGQYDRAVVLYQSYMDSYGESAALLNNLSLVLVKLKRFDKAVELAQKAYESVPNHPAIQDTLGWAYTNAGQHEKALPLYRDALALDSDNAEIMYHLAVNLIALNRTQEARRYLSQVLDSDQQFTDKAKAEALLSKLN